MFTFLRRRKPALVAPQTPGAALDAALSEERGMKNDLIGDLMGEIEQLEARVVALKKLEGEQG